MPDHVARGATFGQRFIEWFRAGRIFGIDVRVQQVRAKVTLCQRTSRSTANDEINDSTPRRLLEDPPLTRHGKVRLRRLDVLAVIEEGDEKPAVIIELKSTDWSRMSRRVIRRNVARHASQMYSYQGHLTNEMWNEDTQE